MNQTQFKLLFLIIIIFSLSSIAHSKGKSYGDILDVEYVRTYDGDTIFFNLPGFHPLVSKNIGVRVRGIDTPEIRGKCVREKRLAQEAKLLVQSTLESARTIHLLNISRGKYFRIVVDALMEARLGVRYSGGKKQRIGVLKGGKDAYSMP